MSRYSQQTELSNAACERCDYGPLHGHDDECRGNYDPDEPCRNAEPEEYEEDGEER